MAYEDGPGASGGVGGPMRRRVSRVRRRRRRRAIRVRQLASRRRRHRQRRTRLHPFIYTFQKPPATTPHTPPSPLSGGVPFFQSTKRAYFQLAHARTH